jgi:hypothetical protein
MDDLVAFLRARLDEDEQVARATPYPWPWAEDEDEVGHVWAEGLNLVVKDAYPENARHIARWDPARVLAEVEAKRRILDEVVPEVDGMDERINGEWGIGSIAEDDYASVPLLKLLALPYAAHPDYREEWRP